MCAPIGSGRETQRAVSAHARLDPADPPESAIRFESVLRDEEGCLEVRAWERPPLRKAWYQYYRQGVRVLTMLSMRGQNSFALMHVDMDILQVGQY